MKARIQTNRVLRMGKPPVRHGMSESHLDNVRQCCCLICGSDVVDAHHLMRSGERGAGMKSPDKYAVPLCNDLNTGHHLGRNGPHAHGDEDCWFAEHGLDGRAIAASLWRARGDLEAMRRIAFNQFQKVRTAK